MRSTLALQHLGDTVTGGDGNLGLGQTGLLRIRLLEDLIEFFKGAVLCFDVEHVDKKGLESVPGNVQAAVVFG